MKQTIFAIDYISDNARTVESLIRDLERMRGVSCSDCEAPLCSHQVLMSIALGFKDAPRCLPCLGAALNRNPAWLRDSLFAHIRQRQCYWDVWNWANRAAALPEGIIPPTLQSLGSGAESQSTNGAPLCAKHQPQRSRTSSHAAAGSATTAALQLPPADTAWDAGDMGCGELVLELRLRLAALPLGKLFHLTARDPGAREDLPAWCRLTGHTLVRAEHPNYWIRRQG